MIYLANHHSAAVDLSAQRISASAGPGLLRLRPRRIGDLVEEPRIIARLRTDCRAADDAAAYAVEDACKSKHTEGEVKLEVGGIDPGTGDVLVIRDVLRLARQAEFGEIAAREHRHRQRGQPIRHQ